jgi:hypothetical protein
MARAFTVLLFAVIATALALLDHFYLADAQTVYAPQTTAEWISYFGVRYAPSSTLPATSTR